MIKINEYVVTEKEFQMACSDLCARIGSNTLKKEYVDAIVNQLIEARLIINEAKKMNLLIDDGEIDAIVNKIKKSFKDEQQFLDILKKENDTVETLSAKIKDDLLLKKFIDTQFYEKVEILESDMKKYYDENPSQFKNEAQVQASHILFDLSDLDLAKKVKVEIEAGLAFEEAAAKHSKCPSKDNGGSLGFFGRGQMVPEFEEVVFNAEINVITAPVETQFGYHLIKVTEKSDETTLSFDEVKDELIKHFKNSRVSYEMSLLTKKLRETATIEIDQEILSKYEKSE